MTLGLIVLALPLTSSPVGAAYLHSVMATEAQVCPPPPAPSDGSAVGSIVVDPATNRILYDISFSDLNGTVLGAHLHGLAGPCPATSAIRFTLRPHGAFSFRGDTTYAETDEASILSGLLYLDIHTSANPAGQVRDQIETLISDVPVAFSVTDSATSAEGLLQPDPGQPFFGHPSPNDVFALGGAGPWGFPTGGELFQSPDADQGAPDGTNVDRLSAALGVTAGAGGSQRGPYAPNVLAPNPVPNPPLPNAPNGTLGLRPDDDIDALSFGEDGGNVLLFSVNHAARGAAGSEVRAQAVDSKRAQAVGGGNPSNGGGDPGDEAAGDVFVSSELAAFGGPANVQVRGPADNNSNVLGYDELLLGLQAPAVRHSTLLPRIEDDLDALEITSMSVVDADGDGVVDAGRRVFISLRAGSPTLAARGLSGAHILVAEGAETPDSNTIRVYVTPGDLGLQNADDLDALALHDTPPAGVWGAGDKVLFSLRGGSPTLPAQGYGPGDVILKSFGMNLEVYARGSDLGLVQDGDELDALDVAEVGEPTSSLPGTTGWGIGVLQVLMLLTCAAALRGAFPNGPGRQRS